MVAHTGLGFLLAQGIAPTLHGQRLGILVLVLISWVVCLNGGTLGLNSAFDRDEGDVGYLDAPPPPPRHLAAFSILLMVGGGLIALRLPRGFQLAYLACVIMSLVYSVPPVRLKAVAGADWVINMIGFGTLTPYAGWAATGLPVSTAGAWILWGFCPLFASLYPLTQLYQLEEDTRRGDRTLAIRIGMRGSLMVSIGMAAVAFGAFAMGARAWDAPRIGWVALALSSALWGMLLLRWYARHEAMRPVDHQRGMYLALGCWAVTDVAVLLVAS